MQKKIIAFLFTFFASASWALVIYAEQGGGTVSEDYSIRLPKHAENLTFLPDSHTVLLTSNRERRIFIFDLNMLEVVKEFEYPTPLGSKGISYSDVAVNPEGTNVFLIGVLEIDNFSKDRRPGLYSKDGILTQIDLKDSTLQSITLSEPMRAPSVAVSENGRVFFGDLNSSTVSVIEKADRKFFMNQILRRSNLEGNIYLSEGPAIDLGVSADGRFILVSHAQAPSISLIDSEFSEVVDHLGPIKKRGGFPFTMLVTNDKEATSSFGPKTYILVGEFEADVLAVTDINGKFSSFGKTNIAPLLLSQSIQKKDIISPLLIVSAANDLNIIVVGSRLNTNAAIFSRIQGGLERRNIVKLKTVPDDIDVSPNGQIVTILNSEHRSLRVIKNPLDWMSEPSTLIGSEVTRKAQRWLSVLHYPIGVVDGLYGEDTRRSLLIFQQSAGLVPTGTINSETLKRIENVVSEIPDVFLGEDLKKNDIISNQQCISVDVSNRCEKSSLTTGANSQGVICIAPKDASRPIQIDTYQQREGKSLQYSCTSYHSCEFIRFVDPQYYYNNCH